MRTKKKKRRLGRSLSSTGNRSSVGIFIPYAENQAPTTERKKHSSCTKSQLSAGQSEPDIGGRRAVIHSDRHHKEFSKSDSRLFTSRVAEWKHVVQVNVPPRIPIFLTMTESTQRSRAAQRPSTIFIHPRILTTRLLLISCVCGPETADRAPTTSTS